MTLLGQKEKKDKNKKCFGYTDRWTDRQTDRQTDQQMERKLDIQMNR